MRKAYIFILFFLSLNIYSQDNFRNSIIINAGLDTLSNSIFGLQEITYNNNSKDTLSEIFLHSWPSAYRNRNTVLGKRRVENRKSDIYFAKAEEKGDINGFLFLSERDTLFWNYTNHSHDIIHIELNKKLYPGKSIIITTPFKLKLPNARFTGYGYSKNGYYLKEWYLSPAVYKNGKWHTMSNKNLDDLFIDPYIYLIKLNLPKDYELSSNLLYKNNYLGFNKYQATISGKMLGSVNVMIYNKHTFIKHEIETKSSNIIKLETDLRYPYVFKVSEPIDSLLAKQLNFLEEFLGPYKSSKLWISKVYIKNNPIYSMNTIPMITTMGPKFQKEIEIFKSISHQYIKSSIYTNIRENAWMVEGLNSFVLAKYIEKYYPDKKLFGNLSDYWISKYFDLSDLKFNEREKLLYLIMARQNIDQTIGQDYDKFTNLNKLAMTQFKTSMGFAYLNDYIGTSVFNKSIHEIFEKSNKEYIDPKYMKRIFANNTDNKSDWFFDDYIDQRNLIDFKIINKDDKITIKNKTTFTGPFKIYGYKKDSLVFAEWREGFTDTITYTPTSYNIDRIVINDNSILPEYIMQDNTVKYNKKWYNIIDKPLRLKLMTDIENPNYSQVFVNPEASWNAYDGFLIGGSFYNKSIIRKPFMYKISPLYGFTSKSLTGSVSASYTHYFRDNDYLNSIRFGAFAKYFHYDRNLSYLKYNPAISLDFIKPDPRGVVKNSLMLRYVNVDKEKPKNIPIEEEYLYDSFKILNLRHSYQNPDIIDDFRARTDLQLGDQFGKLSSEIRFRKLTDWNNKIDFRFFAGIFLYNNNDNNHYDFGINSSTDYLFDYNFLGRSETSGILSQQIIVNDGAFKTKYNTFANQWLLSTNTHVSVWKFFEIYGDVGAYKNRGDNAKFIWDTGVRFNFVPEILEFYFPIYSNKGSEFAAPHYEERIRFVFTADFGEIVEYFRRGLY